MMENSQTEDPRNQKIHFMAAKVRKIAGYILSYLQSQTLWRLTGRRLFHGIRIKEASASDLVYIHKRLNLGSPCAQSLPNREVTNLIATWHGRTLGFAQLEYNPPSHAPYVGYWIISLSTLHPLYRGLGIGEALCRAMLTIAREGGADEVFLGVKMKNHPAINLYRKLGFEQICVPGLDTQPEEAGQRQEKLRMSMMKYLHE
jgi:ribosomal protein S18 acetylase RimI-like enzyme